MSYISLYAFNEKSTPTKDLYGVHTHTHTHTHTNTHTQTTNMLQITYQNFIDFYLKI